MTISRKMVHVYVTEEEKGRLKDRAQKAGLSLSKYLLGCGLSATQAADVHRAQPERVKVSKPDRSLEVKQPDEPGEERGFFQHESTIAKRKRLGKL